MMNSYTPAPTGTPRRHSAPIVSDTPHCKRDSSTTGILSGDSIRGVLDAEMRAELGDHVYIDIPLDNFFGYLLPQSHYPNPPDLNCIWDAAVESGDYDALARRWANFPSPPTKTNVVLWFGSVVNKLVAAAVRGISHQHHPWLGSPCNRDFTYDTAAGRRVELVVLGIDGPASKTYDWRNVRVFCELKSNVKKDIAYSSDTGIQLANYAREILHAQPTCLYVHGITLCGDSLMRCFFVDRSGVLGSSAFSIHENPRLFLCAMIFYCTADSVGIGLDPTVTAAIRWVYPRVPVTYDPTTTHWTTLPTHAPTVELPHPENPDARVRFLIRPEPTFVGVAVISRGSACWPSRLLEDDDDNGATSGLNPGSGAREESGEEKNEKEGTEDEWPFVIKVQWHDEIRDPEGVLLKCAQGIQGVVQYYSHEDCTSAGGAVIDTKNFVRHSILGDSSYPQRKKLAMLQGSSSIKRKQAENESLPTEPLNRVLTRLAMMPLGRPLTKLPNYYTHFVLPWLPMRALFVLRVLFTAISLLTI